MFRRSLVIICVALATVFLSACKIVKNPTPAEVASSNMTDAQRMEAYVEKHWDPDFWPFYKKNAYPFNDVRSALRADLESAGEKFGLRQDGEANPWNFVVNGDGLIVSANTKSRAATADIDTDGDGKPDFILQLGPVIKGTTLRDTATFLTFSDFRDQIEYAKLGRALNSRIHKSTTSSLPMENLVGTKISFVAAFTMRTAKTKLSLTPIHVEAHK